MKGNNGTPHTTRWLPVKLTDDEILQRARTMSEKCKEKELKEAEKAAATRSFGEELKKLSGEVNQLSRVVSTGLEWQHIECRIEKDFTKKKIFTIRTDTNQIVEERDILIEETQEKLPGAIA